jgi:hypothetical protein
MYSAVSEEAESEADLEWLKRRNLVAWAWSIERVMFDSTFQDFMDQALPPSP